MRLSFEFTFTLCDHVIEINCILIYCNILLLHFLGVCNIVVFKQTSRHDETFVMFRYKHAISVLLFCYTIVVAHTPPFMRLCCEIIITEIIYRLNLVLHIA